MVWEETVEAVTYFFICRVSLRSDFAADMFGKDWGGAVGWGLVGVAGRLLVLYRCTPIPFFPSCSLLLWNELFCKKVVSFLV